MQDDNLKIDEKVRHHQHRRFTLLALFSNGGNSCWVGMNKCSQDFLILKMLPRVLVPGR